MNTPFEYAINPTNLDVVVGIAGGTGGRTLMASLRPYAVWPVALCTVCDSGGSTGLIREAYSGILAVGDIRNCAEALMDEEFHGMLDIRLPRGDGQATNGLAEHPLINLLYLGAIERARKEGRDQITAIAKVNRFLKLKGEVWPVSPTPAHLVGTLCDGTEIVGEHLLDRRPLSDARVLRDVRIDRRVQISRSAYEAIRKAKLIVFGPGDLFTSLRPILEVEGVKEAIAESNAPVVYNMNLMSKFAETRAFTPRDFLEKILERGIGRERFDAVLMNTTPVPQVVRDRYLEREGAEPIMFSAVSENDLQAYTRVVLPSPLLDTNALELGSVRHDRAVLGATLVELTKTGVRT